MALQSNWNIKTHIYTMHGFTFQIRASNFTHCSIATSMMNGEASPWNYKEAHQVYPLSILSCLSLKHRSLLLESFKIKDLYQLSQHEDI